MILQALYEYYRRKVADPDPARQPADVAPTHERGEGLR